MTMKTVGFRITQKDFNYLKELVDEGYAVSKSEALRRLMKESRFYLTNYCEADNIAITDNRSRYRTRFNDDVLDKLIKKGIARMDPANGLMILDEFSLNAICDGENPKNKTWVPYGFYECPLHSHSLDCVVKMAAASLKE